MLYTILILLTPFLNQVSNDTTVSVESNVHNQITYYSNNLIRDENSEQYIWALSELIFSSCSKLHSERSHFISLGLNNFHDFSCEEVESEDFKKDRLWTESNKALYKKLKTEIIDNETEIDENALIKKVPHLYLELLMGPSYSEYFTNDFLSSSTKFWEKELSKTENELKRSLIVSIIIWSSFIIDDYSTLNKYIPEFLNSESFPYSNKRLKIYGALDYTYYTYGQYDKSLDLLKNYSIPLSEYIGDQELAYKLKIRQGVYLYSLGKYKASKNIYEGLYAQSGINDFYVFTNLGLNYYKLGFSNKYISLQLQALEYDSQNYRNLLKVYRNLFLYYTNAKDINTALQYIEKAKELATNYEDTTELALIDSYLGAFYWTQYKNHQKALENFNSAQKILSPENNYSRYVELLYEKGNIYMRIDSLDKARVEFETGKKLALSKSNTVDYVDALINLTAIELKDGSITAAQNILNEILLYPLDNLDFPLLTKYYAVKSEYLYVKGSHRTAIQDLRPIIQQVLDRAKNNTDSQQGYWSVEEEYLDAFALMVNLLIKSNQPEEALKLLDQFKTINDASLYNSPLVKAAKLSEEDLAEEKRLNQRLQSLRKKYLNASQESRFEIKTEIDRVSAEREQILSEVNLNKDRPLSSIWSIQRLIDSDELVLHFTEIGDHLYVSHLTNNEVRIQKLEFTAETQERFNAIGDEIASGKTNLNHLYELYQFLDLDDIPSHINQISVVPDNYLYRIPLEVLPVKTPDSPISFGSARYLIEDHQFRYFTSLKEFESNRRSFNTDTENTFSAFAISNFKNFESTGLPSLPYATVETHNINAVLTSFSNSNKKIYTETEATKNAFKQQVGSSRMVHVATHSEVSEQDPLFSTIYLKNSNPGDTLESDQALYAYELFDTPLNSEFIMLNSCSSGSGNYIQGSGIMGISRALRYAGAKSLALNLWSVNDKVASEFATDFYGFLNEGETKSEAIRKAKLNQIKGANANPHFWGAYMMIGNPSPVTEKPGKPMLLYSLLGLTIFFIGYSTYKMEAA